MHATGGWDSTRTYNLSRPFCLQTKRGLARKENYARELTVDGFVQRYDTERVNDGLPPGEGVFLACSFWMVSSLKAIGREEDGRKLFERLLTLCNDLGLLSEEYAPKSKRLLGNFPQAFSHIALITAAFELEYDSVRSTAAQVSATTSGS